MRKNGAIKQAMMKVLMSCAVVTRVTTKGSKPNHGQGIFQF
jgi:hypothetical protein